MFQPPYGKPWLLYGLFGCSLALNVIMLIDSVDDSMSEAGSTDADDVQFKPSSPTVESGTAAATGEEPSAALASVAPGEAITVPPTEPVPTAMATGNWNIVEASVEHSLARTFVGAAGDQDGAALAQVFARLFVWDMDLRRDLLAGDQVEVAWRRDAHDQIEIAAARLHSRKLGRTLTAYRWQAPGDSFASYWQEDGTEVPRRLIGGPLKDYEQITSLLKDRPRHGGMDFKVPVGTQVRSPHEGKVLRANWNWKNNGNCLEVRYDDGSVARFLHLSENKVKAGQKVKPGQILALTGNTGRSTAPHLHYEIEKGGKTVDPLDHHGTVRRKLEAPDMPGLQAEVNGLDSLLSGGVARR